MTLSKWPGRKRPPVARRQCRIAWRTPAVSLSIALTMVLATVAAFSLPTGVRAAEWLVEGRADLRGEYDDNITLDPTNELSVFGATFSPEVDIGGRSQNWDLFLNTRLDFARFTEQDFLNSEDQQVELEGSYRTQLGVWDLDAMFRRATTRTTELTDTGRVEVGAERLDFRVQPSWRYVLGQRDSIFVNGRWDKSTFDVSTLNDFTRYSAGGGWTHQLTEQDDLTLSGFASHFENDSISGNESDTFGSQLGWHRVYSERLETRIAVGPRYTTSDSTVTSSNNSLGFIVDGEVNYDLDDRTLIAGNLSRSIAASGGGSVVERDVVRLSVRHQYEPELAFRLSIYYLQNRDANDQNAASDREYFAVEPGVSWQFERDWFLTGGYRYRTQELTGESRATSNAVFVTLRHQFPKWTFAN